jgi:hypothetical protein
VGAGAAAAAEVVAAPLGVATIAAAILGDLVTLSYFQVELSLKIAAAYGHDLGDFETRTREILHLHGLEMIGGDNLGPVIGKGGERVGKRLLMLYLKGDALNAAKSLFRFVGIKFTRAGLIKMLPFVNVPAGAAVADITTRRSASKARKFYAMLPPPEESVPVRLSRRWPSEPPLDARDSPVRQGLDPASQLPVLGVDAPPDQPAREDDLDYLPN